jgi:predicted DNA-binding transcriptional regulator AlpA
MSAERERLLRLNEVAEMLAVKPHTINQWNWRGLGPPALKIHGRVRYRLADVEKWIEEQTANDPVEARRGG